MKIKKIKKKVSDKNQQQYEDGQRELKLKRQPKSKYRLQDFME